MDPDYYERECNRLNAELAKAWAEIERLRALMVVHPGCTCRLCSDVRALREARDGS